MKCTRNGFYYQLRLERGEEIAETLVKFVRQQRISSGVILGLGAADAVVLGHFSLKTRTYRKKKLLGECEIVSMSGNIAWHGTDPVCHVHVVVSDSKMRAWAGHLFSGRVAATCEVSILVGQKKLLRAEDKATGLKLLRP